MGNVLDKFAVGQRIRQLRLTNGYTQAEFADSIDISINFLSEIENGKKGLSQETLAKICMQLDVSADYILFNTESATSTIIEIANSLTVHELKITIQYLQSLLDIKKMLEEKQAAEAKS